MGDLVALQRVINFRLRDPSAHISATVVAFDLERVGHPSVRVCDGSRQERAADPSLPMSTEV
jgi:hypothetical protein